MQTRMESRVEAPGSHIEGNEQTIAALELGRQEDKERVIGLEATHEELHRKLDSLIDLNRAQAQSKSPIQNTDLIGGKTSQV